VPDDPLTARLRAAGCVFAEDEAAVLRSATHDPEVLELLVTRRVAGEPLEVVVGSADFCGVRVRTAAGVFVPRTRTGLMVRVAVQHLAHAADREAVVLDLCCGTGAVGVAVLAAHGGPVRLVASDVDPAAVACARLNVEPVGGTVVASDLYDDLPPDLAGRVDVLTCNAPYVPSEAVVGMPPEARDHEALVALDGGADGLDVHRRVVGAMPPWLSPAGVLVVEVAPDQAPVLAALLARAETVDDDDRGATAIVGR
jgi:release factor glutamine methyltransferase